MKPANFVSMAEYQAMLAKGQNTNKYKAQRVEVPGHGWFDSKHELDRYLRLLPDPRVHNLRRQVPFRLVGAKGGKVAIYWADFTYWWWEPKADVARFVVEDAKGLKTSVYRLKKKLLMDQYGIAILET